MDNTEPKKTYIRIRVTEKEKEAILKKAANEKKTLSRFVLEKVLPEKFEWEKSLSNS
jgi:uncharacterized protein (DUF1778 family)